MKRLLAHRAASSLRCRLQEEAHVEGRLA